MAEAAGLRLIIASYNLRHGISSEEEQNDALHLVGDRPDRDRGENRSPRCLSKELSADLCSVSDFKGAGFAFRIEPDGTAGLPVAGLA